MKKCKVCGELLNESMFYKVHVNKTSGGFYYRNECKKCFNAICNENGRDIKRKRVHEVREYSLKKLGGKCYNCGNTDKNILHFHHLNPETKIDTLTRLYNCTGKKSFTRVNNELRKCIILCNSCHSKLHAKLRKNVKSL